MPAVLRRVCAAVANGQLRRSYNKWMSYTENGALRRVARERNALRQQAQVLATEVSALENDAAESQAHWSQLEAEVERLIGYSPLPGMRPRYRTPKKPERPWIY